MKNNWIFWIGLGAFMLMLVLAFTLYQERTIIFDPAFHLFSIVRKGEFAIQVHRFGAFFTQLFPLVAVKLGLSLKAIMISYSISFILLDALLFGLLLRPLRQPYWALALLLNSVLMVNETFYWIQSELKQGLSMLIFYLGFIHSNKVKSDSVWYLPIHAGMLSLLAFTHPLLVFPFIFGLGLLIRTTGPENRRELFSLGVTFLLFYLIKSQLFRNWYDDAQMQHLGNLVTYFPNYFSVPTNALFFQYLLSDYYFLIPAFLGLMYLLLVQKNYAVLSWYLLFCTGYLLLVNTTYPDPTQLRKFYSEQFYLPLGTMTLIALALHLHFDAVSRWLPVAIALIIVVRLQHIYALHYRFTEKIAWQRQFMRTQAGDKIIYPEKEVPEAQKLIYTWGSAEEFWLLSTLDYGETKSIVITDDPEALRKHKDQPRLFITKHKVFDYADLPSRYFLFKDTTSPYTIYAPPQ